MDPKISAICAALREECAGLPHALDPGDAEELFHYTTGEGLLGIVRERTIRAGHIDHMNDPREIREGEETAIDVFRSKMSWFPETEELVRFIRNWRRSQRMIFVASFSKNGKSLPQWREYAQGGQGYALRFSTDSTRWAGREFIRCVYDPTEARDLCSRLIAPVVDVFARHLEVAPANSRTPLSNNFAIQVSQKIGLCAAAIKHPDFSTEEEYRLVEHHAPRMHEVGYRTTRFGVSPYIPCRFSMDALLGVTLGPLVKSETNVRAVQMMLMTNDHPTAVDSVVPSEITLQ